MFKNIKVKAQKLYQINPNLYGTLYRIYHKIHYLKVLARHRLNSDAFKLVNKTFLTIPLDRIIFGNFDEKGQSPIIFYGKFDGIGQIKGGDWDLVKTEIKDMKIFKALQQYLLEGKDIKTTDYYAGKATSNDQVTCGAWFNVYEENYEEHIKRNQELFNSIKNNGYKSQKELGNPNEFDEIRVRIDRNGAFLFENSLHRLIIAKILNVKSVPVVVTLRHSNWVQIKKDFFEFANSRKNGQLYQKLPHPDLAKIRFSHKCDDRFEQMKKWLLNIPKGNALDIGAYLGFFCHKLDDLGFNCTAVEADKYLAHYLEVLQDIENKNFDVIPDDILSPKVQTQICSKEYSVVLAVNVFHHFIKDKESFEKFKILLNRLKMHSMIFEPHNSREPQMSNAYKNFDSDEFVSFIIENSCLKEATLIGNTTDGRKLYFISEKL